MKHTCEAWPATYKAHDTCMASSLTCLHGNSIAWISSVDQQQHGRDGMRDCMPQICSDHANMGFDSHASSVLCLPYRCAIYQCSINLFGTDQRKYGTQRNAATYWDRHAVQACTAGPKLARCQPAMANKQHASAYCPPGAIRTIGLHSPVQIPGPDGLRP